MGKKKNQKVFCIVGTFLSLYIDNIIFQINCLNNKLDFG